MTAFKLLVRFRIAANLALAGYLLWAPERLAKMLLIEVPNDPAFMHALAIAYVFLALAYLPSAISPRTCMANNLFVLLGPIVPVILLLVIGWSSPALMWLAAYELAFAVALNVGFRRGYVAELMTKP